MNKWGHIIINLGDRNSKTVGHLPQVVYKDYSAKNGIIIIKIDNYLAGFVMFRKAKRANAIKIAQLCIDEKFRGQGLADGLIKELKSRFESKFRSIQLTCRKDYLHASEVWRRNGFYPFKEKPGRGKKETILIIWAYTFDKVDLFSFPSEIRTRAVLDINIIIRTRDLGTDNDYPENPIRYLYSDDLTSEVDYYYANESLVEILNDRDINRRSLTRNFLSRYIKLKMNQDGANEVYRNLCLVSPPKDDNGKSDRKQLTEAIVNNIEYFITADENFINEISGKIDEYSISILTPTEFIIRFDQIQNESTYLPRNIGAMNTSFRKPSGPPRKYHYIC